MFHRLRTNFTKEDMLKKKGLCVIIRDNDKLKKSLHVIMQID